MLTYIKQTFTLASTLPHQQRVIPCQLFSADANKYDIKWAKNTFRYAHVFNATISPSTIFKRTNKLTLWLIEGKSILEQALKEGEKLARKKIFTIATNDYGWKMPGQQNVSHINHDDVIETISNK
eukprot:6715989-Ditylum_brightwellii.AAC.1